MQAERPQPRDRLRARRLHRVGDDDRGAGRAVPAGEHDRVARAVRRRPAAARSSGSRRHRRSRRAGARGRRSPRGRRPRPRTPRPSMFAKSLDRRRARPSRRRARPSAIARRSGAPTRLRAAPTIRSTVVDARRPRPDDVDERHAPGRDGAGLVEHDRVDPAGRLEDLGALDEDAELRAAAGARPAARSAWPGPSAHGQAMISTATAAVKAVVAGSPSREPDHEGGDRERDHDRHEDRRDPVGEPLHGRLAGLGLGDEPARSGRARCRSRPASRARRAGRPRSPSRR